MTPRRKNLLILLPVFGFVTFLGGIGSIEAVILFTALLAWVYAFVVWARRRPGQR